MKRLIITGIILFLPISVSSDVNNVPIKIVENFAGILTNKLIFPEGEPIALTYDNGVPLSKKERSVIE